MLELYLVMGGLMNTCQYGFIYAIIHVMQEHFMPVIKTWRTTQENSTTTRQMALSWLNN
jgi:hypothetical protein